MRKQTDPVNLSESYLIANLDKLELPISGMNSAVCVSRIEKGLSKNQCVSDAKVNFTTEKASIAYDFSQLNCFDLVRTISELAIRSRPKK